MEPARAHHNLRRLARGADRRSVNGRHGPPDDRLGEERPRVGQPKVGTDASAAAGPVGKDKSAADLATKGDVLSYTKATGLFAGVSLTGSVLKPDEDAIFALYGARIDLRAILEGQAPMPGLPSVQRFVGTLGTAIPPPSGLAER